MVDSTEILKGPHSPWRFPSGQRTRRQTSMFMLRGVKVLRRMVVKHFGFWAVHHSRSAASFCRDSLQPSSLFSGRMPFGMPSQSTVTSVPPSASAKLTIILISPANAGSCDSNSMTSTIFA